MIWSANRYENHMREIKKLIKKPQQILQQLYHRFAEIAVINETHRTEGWIGNERQFLTKLNIAFLQVLQPSK